MLCPYKRNFTAAVGVENMYLEPQFASWHGRIKECFMQNSEHAVRQVQVICGKYKRST